MCGICGMVTSQPVGDSEIVRRMNRALIHRGPDGEGAYDAPHLAMAMRRLSIIGLNDGWQPIYNETRSLTIIANGEIYNYVELRADLEKRGHCFSTHSDVETILHLYEESGIDCLHSLRGMFAFALWDSKRQQLILARDRIGEKPLYLYETENTLYFASEIRALLETGKINFEFDPVSVHLYFHYGYVPEPRTPLKNVRKLPAGHYLVIETEPWGVEERTYWCIEDIPPLEGDPVELIRQQLEELSALVIRSDVPVGVALSGGIDSSAIAALAARTYPGVLQAFSVGYPGRPGNDEREQAKDMADTLKIPFHDVELSTEEHNAIFEDLVSLRDDPIADISGFGYYAVSRKAREMEVPVLLQGQGGDELFWGYEWVRRSVPQTIRKQARLDSGPGIWPRYINFHLPPGFSPRALWHWSKSIAPELLRGMREWRRDGERPRDEMVYMDPIADFHNTRHRMPNYYAPAFMSQIQNGVAEEIFIRPHPWIDIPVTITQLVMQTYLLENGITQGDRLSMANSVELRLPLVDYRLVETVIGLRRNYPDHSLPAKYWLKMALQGLLSDKILSRPKQGFTPPVHEWHRLAFEKYGKSLADGLLVQIGLLRPAAGVELSSGAFPPGRIIPISFKALVLELWARRMTVN